MRGNRQLDRQATLRFHDIGVKGGPLVPSADNVNNTKQFERPDRRVGLDHHRLIHLHLFLSLQQHPELQRGGILSTNDSTHRSSDTHTKTVIAVCYSMACNFCLIRRRINCGSPSLRRNCRSRPPTGIRF